MRSLFLLLVPTAAAVAIACGHSPPKDPNEPTPATTATSEEQTRWEGASSTPSATATGTGAPMPTAPPPRRTDVYDKEATEVVLKRAARQVKDNCGQAKDDDGKASGPWGKTNVTVTLGHNGHTKSVSIPPPYDGKATGKCTLQAFSNLTFPPWGGEDTPVDWEVELVQPDKAAPAGGKKNKAR